MSAQTIPVPTNTLHTGDPVDVMIHGGALGITTLSSSLNLNAPLHDDDDDSKYSVCIEYAPTVTTSTADATISGDVITVALSNPSNTFAQVFRTINCTIKKRLGNFY